MLVFCSSTLHLILLKRCLSLNLELSWRPEILSAHSGTKF